MTQFTTWEKMMYMANHPSQLPSGKLDTFLDTIQEWDHEGVCELVSNLFIAHPHLLDLIHIDDDGSVDVLTSN